MTVLEPEPVNSSVAAPHGRRTPTLRLTEEQAGALRTMLYYQIFRFPLRADEIRRLADHPWTTTSACADTLDSLERAGLVRRLDDWCLLGDTSDLDRRRDGEAGAAAIMAAAMRRSRLISRFPFVRGVALSGTLSKGIFHKGDDIDFFVITAPRRLWICRTLLMVFKKTVLLNSRRRFCINYFITEDHLVIPDQNRFSAAELAWLLPTVNLPLFDAFFAANDWASTYLPNLDRLGTGNGTGFPARPSKTEGLFVGRFGDAVEARFRRLIESRNRRKYRHLEADQFDLALRSEANSSKHHPRSLQSRVLDRYERAVRDFEGRHGVDLGGEA